MRKKLLTILSFLTLTLGFTSCKTNTNVTITPPNKTEEPSKPVDTIKELEFEGKNVPNGQSFKLLGTIKRQNPEISNEGCLRYPVYGTSIENITQEEKIALINESDYLKSSSTTYDKMDKDGNLYLNGEKLNRKLYKHSTSSYNFYGEPDANEDAVIKEITTNARVRGNHLTGLYAPAGEVITVEISENDLKKTGGVYIELGQYAQNNQLNNIWEARNDFSRMPLMGTEMLANETTNYVGSFLGGPIYITPKNPCEFTVKISGALEYCHFIYGLTTKEEFQRLSTKSAPYFDLEVWDTCVRHSGPKKYANFDYDNLNKISAFWLSVSNISRQIPMGSSADLGIDFIYDPFVCAGAAVAIVGRNWCNLPPGWMENALDYDSFTSNGGWGTIHEYNHHFQRYGFAPGDEVTNNALSILSYINYTNISANRPNLEGWNRYLNPSTSLKETLEQSKNGQASSSLNTYVDIIHTFGVDTFIKAASYKKGQGGVDAWYESLSEATGYNMDYYFSLIHQTPSDSIKDKYKQLKPFIPVTLDEQTGRIIKGKTNITVLPYPIALNETYTIDLDNNLTIPEGFTYKIKSVSKPSKGFLVQNGNTLTYTPDGTNTSGQILLSFDLENKELNLNTTETIVFELCPQYQGINKTTYSYDSNIYSSIEAAQSSEFKGYTSVKEEIVKNHFVNGITNNQICVYKGKIYMEQDGDYTISVRTSNRSDTRLRLGKDSSYTKTISSYKDNPIDYKTTNHTFNVKKGEYIYFEVVIKSYSNDAYAELFGSYNKELKSINKNLILNEKAIKKIKENVDYYPRVYNNIELSIPYENQKVYSYTTAYSCWDDNYKIDNILDGNPSTSYHSVSNKMINSEPFELTIDLGDTYNVNTLLLTGYNGNQMHLPTKFKLYGGVDINNLSLIDEFNEVQRNGRYAELSFKESYIRYYKLVITDTSESRYVALSDINMTLKALGQIHAPNEVKYTVTNNQTFTKELVQSHYGYVIKGNGKIELDTQNEAFAIKTKEKNAKIKLTINGKQEIVMFNQLFFKKLDSGQKHISIEILDSEISIESFIY